MISECGVQFNAEAIDDSNGYHRYCQQLFQCCLHGAKGDLVRSQNAGESSAPVLGLQYPSAEGRLPESLHFAESDVIFGAVRARSVHKAGYGRNCDWAAA